MIVHKSDASLLFCYVDHHDKAYDWAERRKLETPPTTGAAQLVEIRETVKEIVVPVYVRPEIALMPGPAPALKPLFDDRADDELLRYGIPAEWLNDVKKATEDTLLALSDHIPAEAAEALLELAIGGKPRVPQPAVATANPFDHPDAQRRFRVMINVEELQRALDFPWEKWTVFRHPEQRQWVERDYAGPARVSGFAGTGKTIVAENRLARGTMIRRLRLDPDAAPFSVGRPDSNLESTVSTMPESPRGYCAAGHHLLGGKLDKASGDVVNLLPQIGLIGFPSKGAQQRLAGHFVPNVIRFSAHPLR